jgi:hypothetical protein
MFGILGKKKKKREFRFKPRYYDPAMEDLRKRVARIKAEMEQKETNPEKAGQKIKEFYTNNQSRKRHSPKNHYKFFMANLRLFLILLVLGILSWKLMQSDFFHQLLENWLHGGRD